MRTSDEELQLIERLAYAASLFSDFSYAESLEHFKLALCPHLRRCDVELQRTALRVGAKTYQGIPLVPFGTVLPSLLVWLAVVPLHAGVACSYVAAGVLGTRADRAFGQLSVAVYNGIFARAVRAPLLALVSELRRSLGGTYG